MLYFHLGMSISSQFSFLCYLYFLFFPLSSYLLTDSSFLHLALNFPQKFYMSCPYRLGLGCFGNEKKFLACLETADSLPVRTRRSAVLILPPSELR